METYEKKYAILRLAEGNRVWTKNAADCALPEQAISGSGLLNHKHSE